MSASQAFLELSSCFSANSDSRYLQFEIENTQLDNFLASFRHANDLKFNYESSKMMTNTIA